MTATRGTDINKKESYNHTSNTTYLFFISLGHNLYLLVLLNRKCQHAGSHELLGRLKPTVSVARASLLKREYYGQTALP